MDKGRELIVGKQALVSLPTTFDLHIAKIGIDVLDSVGYYSSRKRRQILESLFEHTQKGRKDCGNVRVMSRRGDDRVTWDQQKAHAGDPEATAAIREAERIFAQERAKGATAFRLAPGKPAERIEQFDQTAEQIVLVPRVVGG